MAPCIQRTHRCGPLRRRGSVDCTYLKNVLVDAVEAGELVAHKSMLPVFEQLLQLSPVEAARLAAGPRPHKKGAQAAATFFGVGVKPSGSPRKA
jgi:hypothetical protein